MNFNNINNINNIKFLNIMKNFPKLLYDHQFILCSGGSTIWEVLYFNKVPLVINTSDKQSQNSKNLKKGGFIQLIQGKISHSKVEKFLLKGLKKNKTYSKKKRIVDGYGLNRIVKAILDEKKR